MPIARFDDLNPILDVRDVDAALRFYVERLGFQIDFRDDEHPENYAAVRRDGCVCTCNGSTRTISGGEQRDT